MQNKKDINHKFDILLNLGDETKQVERATFFIDKGEQTNAIDTFGCLGCMGTFGSTFGCLGTAGCCC